MAKRKRTWLTCGALLIFLTACLVVGINYRLSEIRSERRIMANLETQGFDFQLDHSGFFNSSSVAHVERAFGLNTATDQQMPDIAKLWRLRSLGLSRSHVTDAGMKYVARLTQLEHLTLDRTRVTDRGLEAICTLPNLRTLSLDRTAVTDAGLKYLARMPSLESVQLFCPGVTDQGVAKFQAQAPRKILVHR